MTQSDCIVVGASFAGLSCAATLARAGLNVTVLEKKRDAGEKLHTTGILVKDVIDHVALLDAMPSNLVRRIDGVRLYAPNHHFVDLHAPGYYFLATDTPELMRWLAGRAEASGARIAYQATYRDARRTQSGFDLGEHGSTRYLVGADGPHSLVAKTQRLGVSKQFLFGIEHEYTNLELHEPDRLHCFIDKQLAPGYIGWVVGGVGVVQVGLARRMRPRNAKDQQQTLNNAMDVFLEKIKHIFALSRASYPKPDSIRAGTIPCGGVISPAAAHRVMLVGDAAGMVSPVTAGGIHTALKHGTAAGHAIRDFLEGRQEDPSTWFTSTYPQFRVKKALRYIFDTFQSDLAANILIGTSLVRRAASEVYFHRKGVF